MKYRAVLSGVPDLERPVQKFGEELTELQRWAEAELAIRMDYPSARVTIYRSVEEVAWMGVPLKQKAKTA